MNQILLWKKVASGDLTDLSNFISKGMETSFEVARQPKFKERHFQWCVKTLLHATLPEYVEITAESHIPERKGIGDEKYTNEQQNIPKPRHRLDILLKDHKERQIVLIELKYIDRAYILARCGTPSPSVSQVMNWIVRPFSSDQGCRVSDYCFSVSQDQTERYYQAACKSFDGYNVTAITWCCVGGHSAWNSIVGLRQGVWLKA